MINPILIPFIKMTRGCLKNTNDKINKYFTVNVFYKKFISYVIFSSNIVKL